MATIVHMTSVHSPFDPRIFLKECRALVGAGHDVTLNAPAENDEVRDGVRLIAVPLARGRMRRMLTTAARVFRTAVRIPADAYHFHNDFRSQAFWRGSLHLCPHHIHPRVQRPHHRSGR